MRQRKTIAVVGGLVFSGVGSFAFALDNADTWISYDPGNFSATPQFTPFVHPEAAQGPLQGDTGFGGMNPFNPPFATNQIVAVGAGGHLTLHLTVPINATGGMIGVFSNAGLLDVSATGTGVTGTPAQTLDEAFGETDPEAIVQVSQDGNQFVALNGGNPILFTNPSNYYLDQSITNYDEPLGTQSADPGKPFFGSLSDFSGKTFEQIKQTVLDGSAGGNWFDLSGSGLSTVNYIRFDVPANATYGMVVDSVSAVPEPVMAFPSILVAVGLLRRRNRRT